MDTTMNQPKPCNISEFIIRSCMEVKNMREGKELKCSLSEWFADIEK